VAAWRAPATGERAGQPIYSATAIETGLALRLVFDQTLHQTEGLLRSIANVPPFESVDARPGGQTPPRDYFCTKARPRRLTNCVYRTCQAMSATEPRVASGRDLSWLRMSPVRP
jgi:hypothetical protein